MSGDGVHLNADGHVLLADTIWKALGYDRVDVDPDLKRALAKRHQVLHAAWLSHVGHQRPSMKAGLPLGKAKEAAAAIALPE